MTEHDDSKTPPIPRVDDLGELGEPSVEELDQAEALAEALERGQLGATRRAALPSEALESAALLRHYRDPELTGESRDRVLAGLLEQVPGRGKLEEPARAGQQSGWSRWLWWWLAPVAAVAGVWLVIRSAGPSAESQMLSSSAPEEATARDTEKQRVASRDPLEAPAVPAARRLAVAPETAEGVSGGQLGQTPALGDAEFKSQQRDLLAAQAELIRDGAAAMSPRLVEALQAVRGRLLTQIEQRDSEAGARELRAAHAAADAARTGQELRAARDQLELRVAELANVAGSKAPMDEAPSSVDPLRVQLLQDGYFRLAEMEQRLGRFERAQRFAELGLAISAVPSVARANLFVIKAQAERARGESNPAAQSLMQALDINEDLMKESLEQP